MNGFAKTQITSVKKENSQVSSFTIHPFPEGFSRQRPGQYLLLKLPRGTGWSEAHPFTVTSRPHEDFLKITVKRIGDFTTALHSIPLPGDVQVSGPLGDYGNRIDDHKTMVFIAGGIGITPFISLLMSLDEKKSTADITLFWANNRVEELFALDFFNELSTRINIKIILVIFEPTPENGGKGDCFTRKTGHLTTKLFEECIEKRTAAFYMCGSENMQRHVFSQIRTLGILPENVETEKFGIYMKPAAAQQTPKEQDGTNP